VLVTEPHHPLLDARRPAIEAHRDDAHQLPAFGFLVLDPAGETPTRFAAEFAPTGVAAVVSGPVDAVE
jgi:hypothetical protein